MSMGLLHVASWYRGGPIDTSGKRRKEHLTSAHVAHSLADHTSLQALMMAHLKIYFCTRADHGVALQKHECALRLVCHATAARAACCSMDGLINASSASQALSRLKRTSMMTGGAITTTDVKDSHRFARVVYDTFTSNTSGRRLTRWSRHHVDVMFASRDGC